VGFCLFLWTRRCSRGQELVYTVLVPARRFPLPYAPPAELGPLPSVRTQLTPLSGLPGGRGVPLLRSTDVVPFFDELLPPPSVHVPDAIRWRVTVFFKVSQDWKPDHVEFVLLHLQAWEDRSSYFRVGQILEQFPSFWEDCSVFGRRRAVSSGIRLTCYILAFLWSQGSLCLHELLVFAP